MTEEDATAAIAKSIQKYESIEIDSVSRYIDLIEELTGKLALRNASIHPWYRGQGNREHPLKPSLYRSSVDPEFEREIIRDFRIKAADFVGVKPQSDIDWLFLAQHHGLPTRILDWTENPLVALYFACEEVRAGSAGLSRSKETVAGIEKAGIGTDEANANFNTTGIRVDEVRASSFQDGRVWILHPWRLNMAPLDYTSVPTTDSKIFEKYIVDLSSTSVDRFPEAEFPLAFRAFYSFRRSNAQSAVFTIHGRKVQGLEKMRRFKNKDFLFSLRIRASAKNALLKELYRIGIHKWGLFQSLDSLAETLKFRYGRSYANK
jgi:hypothetical protein